MLTINDLIKDVYSPPTTNPSRICKCVDKTLGEFLELYSTLSNTSTPKESYLTELNKILDALQDVGALSLGGVHKNGVRKVTSFDDAVWKDTNTKYLRVVNRVDVEHIIDFSTAISDQNVVTESTQPFDTLVAMKYIQKQLNARQRGLEFNLTLQDMKTLLKTKTCFYSGVKLTLTGQTALSLDRKDDKLGYVKGNVVACASIVNQIKNELLEKNMCNGLTNAQIKRMLSSFINVI